MAKVNWLPPGLTVATCESAIGRGMGWIDTAGAIAAGELSRIDQAITAVGLAVCTWDGNKWWWAQESTTFQTSVKSIDTASGAGVSRASNVVTVDISGTGRHGLEVGQWVQINEVASAGFDGTFQVASCPDTATFTYNQVGADATSESGKVHVLSYPLGHVTIDGSIDSATSANQLMSEGWSAERIYIEDDWRLANLPWRTFRTYATILPTLSPTKPLYYTVHGDPPQLFIGPAASSAYDIHVDWVRRHSAITNAESTDTALIVPAEFQWGLYVNGAQWLLKHDTVDAQSLRECPGFMEAMGRMVAANVAYYDAGNASDYYPGTVGTLPHDRRVLANDEGLIIFDSVSV